MNIKALRMKLNLTQEKMANSLNIERSLYAKIENGRNNLTVEQIKRLIKIHKVNPYWILYNEGEMFTAEETNPTQRQKKLGLIEKDSAETELKLNFTEKRISDLELTIEVMNKLLEAQQTLIELLKSK